MLSTQQAYQQLHEPGTLREMFATIALIEESTLSFNRVFPAPEPGFAAVLKLFGCVI